MEIEEQKPRVPTSYAYEALVQAWEADCIALTLCEHMEFERIRKRVSETRRIDKDAENFIFSIAPSRFVERDHPEL